MIPDARGHYNFLERLNEFPDRFLCVTVEHPGVVPVEQVVLYSRETLSLAALEDNHILCLLDIENRHAKQRASLPVRRRVDGVIGTDDEDDVGAGKLRVHFVPVEEVVIGLPLRQGGRSYARAFSRRPGGSRTSPGYP